MRTLQTRVHAKWFEGRSGAIVLCFFVGQFLHSVLMAAPQSDQLVFKKNVSIDELPPGVEKRVLPGTSQSEISEMLSHQPSIVIDGVTLTVNPPRVGSSRSIAVKRIELRNGARIVTNGVNLELYAATIVSDKGQIISFDQSSLHSSGRASDGTSGRSGLSAGTVVLSGSISSTETLVVALPGQDGQAGGTGVTGPGGAPGPRGENGVDHLFDCAHGGGNGGTGSQGGRGGTGGDGGAGGNGGRLILRGNLAKQRVQIDFSAPGGKGGEPGPRGTGGPGGPGGQGGSGSAHCSGGSPGPTGPPGPPGDPGQTGHDGRPGSISAD